MRATITLILVVYSGVVICDYLSETWARIARLERQANVLREELHEIRLEDPRGHHLLILCMEPRR